MSGVSRPKPKRPPASPAAGARPDPPRWLAGLAAVVLLAGGAAGLWMVWSRPAVPARPARPNVLLVTLDTTRADRLGSYGYAGAATPHLDRLAAGGIRFTQAMSPAPLTLPAHASLMTGRNPYAHGVRNNGHFVLAADVPTLAERFAAAGYDTAAFVSSFVLDRQFGLARGFATYDDALDPPRGLADSLELERRGDRTVAAAAAWLAGRPATPSRPYFLWVHLYDAHDPYTPPASYRASFEGRPYDGEIAFQDAMVGELLGRAGHGGASGAPLVVVAGDHGESLGEHGESTHGLFVYESAIRIPLLVSWPGVLAPRVVDPVVGLVDVAPTVTALAGVAPIEGVDGRSLVALVDDRGLDATPPAAAYAETYFPQFFMGWAPLRAVRDGQWKFIDAPEPELYDLAADPGERHNVYAAQPATARSLRRQLETLARSAPGRDSPAPMSAEARQRLSALGYVSGPAAPAPAGAPAPDPKRMAPLFERLLDGNRALARGDAAAAAAIAQGVLAEDAGNGFARLVLGRALLAGGRHREAIDALRAYLTAVPGSADAHPWIALAHLRLGDRARALAEEEAALALDPRHGSAIALRAGLLFSSGRRTEAVQTLRDAVAADSANHALRVSLADLLADAGLVAEAEPEYRRVIDARPNDVSALVGLGLLLARTERFEPALMTLTRVLDLDPGQDEARFEKGAVYERLGRVADARAVYDRLDAPATRPDIRAAAAARLRRLPR
jgi:choline-sulfatase